MNRNDKPLHSMRTCESLCTVNELENMVLFNRYSDGPGIFEHGSGGGVGGGGVY